MTTLASLWLPILLSAVFVFVASSVIHMVLQLHARDYLKLPDEARLLDSLRGKVPPGHYVFPCADSMKDMGSPEMKKKFEQGPVGTLIMRPNGMPFMGKALGQWFVFCIVISVFVAYLTSLALPLGTKHDYMHVFRIAGTVAVLGYAFSNVTDSIWKGVSWAITLRFVFDGVVYGLVTAGTFGWLWPASA